MVYTSPMLFCSKCCANDLSYRFPMIIQKGRKLESFSACYSLRSTAAAITVEITDNGMENELFKVKLPPDGSLFRFTS